MPGKLSCPSLQPSQPSSSSEHSGPGSAPAPTTIFNTWTTQQPSQTLGTASRVCVCVPLQPHAHEGPRLAQGSTCALLKFLIIVKHLYSHFYFAPDPANELTTSPWRSGLLPPLISENEAGLERFRNSLGAHS